MHRQTLLVQLAYESGPEVRVVEVLKRDGHTPPIGVCVQDLR